MNLTSKATPRPRHRRAPRRSWRPWRAALALLKGSALSALLALVVVGGQHLSTPSAPPGAMAESDAPPHVAETAAADHHCSYTGFDADGVPTSALIRTARGTLRQVSFEVGWDVYNHRRPGTLVAVCLEDPAPR